MRKIIRNVIKCKKCGDIIEYGGGVEHLGRCKLNTIVAEN